MIGVFAAQLNDAYQAAVWRGVEQRARQRGTGVVCVLGDRIDAPDPAEKASNVVYGIASRKNIDGLIVITTAIATFLDGVAVGRFFASRKGIPQVSVGFKVPGIPSVTVDGSDGVTSVVRHLVRDHGISRFALIRGPAGHPEAEDRERSFRAALSREKIAFNERLAVRGNFLKESGAEAARKLIKPGLKFDAIVCMNDSMALGALDVLRLAGIRVPDDIAVVGFDGIEEGRYVTPPLTTVVQPLKELGVSAVDTLLRLMDGGSPTDRVLSCVPAIRQSCGCPPRRTYGTSLKTIPAGTIPGDRKAIRELTSRARKGDHDGFIVQLNAALAATAISGSDLGKWNDYLSLVKNRIGRTAPTQLFEFARVLIGETESRLQAGRRVAAEQKFATLRTISASLAGAFEIPLLLARLEAGIAQLGIGGCFLVMFDAQNPAAPFSRLVMAPRNGNAKPLPRGGIRFRTAQLLPAAVKPHWLCGNWVLEPLVFQTEPLGYVLFAGGVEEPAVYDTLQEQVASALKGALLLEQVRTHERRLEIEVARRTAELTRTNTELTVEVEGRMHLEREVLEISNRTMQRIGQDLHDDLCQHLAGIAMHATVLRAGLSEAGPAAISSIEMIGNLLEDSIARAKQIARGLYPAGLEEHGLVSAVEELVESARTKYSAVIDFRASPDFVIPDTDSALQVYRIVQEALSNALKHSGSERVEVRLFHEEDRRQGSMESVSILIAEVSDYGVGLPKTIRGDGMGLRIMRYRAENAGARLDFERLDPGTKVSCRIPITQGDD
jgi:DNA-binding LacI/PurR family transcriptional regulator/signal transduction histidine kinase